MADPNAAQPQLQDQQQLPIGEQPQQQPHQLPQPAPAVELMVDPAAISTNLTRAAADAAAVLPIKTAKNSEDFTDAVELITPLLQLGTSIAGPVRALGQQIPGLAPLVAETDKLERYAKVVYAALMAGCKVQQQHLAVFCRYLERQTPKVHEPSDSDTRLQVLNDKEFKQAHIDVKETNHGVSPLAKPDALPHQPGSRKRSYSGASYAQHYQPPPHIPIQQRQQFYPAQPGPMGPMLPARQGPPRGGAPPGQRQRNFY